MDNRDTEKKRVMKEFREDVDKAAVRLACADWMNGRPMLETAAKWNVDPEEILECFRKECPFRAWWMDAKITFAIKEARARRLMMKFLDWIAGG